MCFSLQIGSISNETGKLHVLQEEECAFTNLTKFFRFLQVFMYFRNKLSQKETHQIIKSSRFVVLILKTDPSLETNHRRQITGGKPITKSSTFNLRHQSAKI